MKNLFALAAALFTLPLLAVDVRAETLSILQGATSTDYTQVTVMVAKGRVIHATLVDLPGRVTIAASSSRVVARATSPWTVQRFGFWGLRLGVNYRLEIRDGAGALLDTRTLRALDVRKPGARWGFISCFRDRLVNEQRTMWTELLAKKPDFILSVGDNVYVDDGPKVAGETPVDRMWRRWAEARGTFEIFKAPELVPYIATWDDHDFGVNDGDAASNVFKTESAEIFKTYFAQDDIPGVYESGPGVSSVFKAFGSRWYLMDNRTWRGLDEGNGVETHWGVEQERWLQQGMRSSDDVVFLMSGSQYYGAYMPGESYERNQPDSFRLFVESLRSVRAPVVFGSGDRHMTEISRIEATELGYPTYELLSSGLAVKPVAGRWLIYPNLRQIAGKDNSLNYMIVDSVARPGGVSMKAVSYGPANRVLFARDMQVDRGPLPGNAAGSAPISALVTEPAGKPAARRAAAMGAAAKSRAR